MRKFLLRLLGAETPDPALEALKAVVASQQAQTDLLKEWIGMFRVNTAAPDKGWVNDDRRMWLEEVKQELSPEEFPTGLTPHEQIEWLEEQIGNASGL